MTVTPILLALSVLATSGPQEIPASRFDHARLATASLLDLTPDRTEATALTGGSAAASRPAAPVAGESAGLTWKQIAHRVGGAVVGGWLGYVGAQVVRSDWDKETNGSFRDQRFSWAAAGAVVGVLGSALFRSTASPRDRPLAVTESTPRAGSYLGLAEIRESQARTAYELIYNQRMHWLVTRGANSVAESPRGEARGDFQISVMPGRDKIIVYMDDVRIGGVEDMREITADILTSARFLDTREATLRYGGGHAHGAILLSTEVSP